MDDSESTTSTPAPEGVDPNARPPLRRKRTRRDNGGNSTKTRLTPALQDLLCETHARNKDFRVATAITCNVHPVLLDRWLRWGLKEEGEEPYCSFALRFVKAEMTIRADLIKELLDAKTKQKVAAITWMLERRFRQWRIDYIPNDWEHEAVDVLASMGLKAGLNLEQKKFLINQMLAHPTGPVMQLLQDNGWVQKELPNGDQETE